MRTQDALDLIEDYPLAYVLAAMIGHRGRYRIDGFNPHGLELGECLLGDHRRYGMSARQYRTCIQKLSKHGFATFKPTSKGTVARLADARLFSIFRLAGDERKDKRATSNRRTTDEQPTSNKEHKTERPDKNRGEGSPPQLSGAERISLEKELERIPAALKAIRDQATEDAFGPKYTEEQRERLRAIKQRRDDIKALLGIVV